MPRIIPETIQSTEITVRIITNRKVYEKKFTDLTKASNYHDDIVTQIEDDQ